jgi:uncharacterized protein YjeT (DUF2065 family)
MFVLKMKENKSIRSFFVVALALLMVLSNLGPFIGKAAAEERTVVKGI